MISWENHQLETKFGKRKCWESILKTELDTVQLVIAIWQKQQQRIVSLNGKSTPKETKLIQKTVYTVLSNGTSLIWTVSSTAELGPDICQSDPVPLSHCSALMQSAGGYVTFEQTVTDSTDNTELAWNLPIFSRLRPFWTNFICL